MTHEIPADVAAVRAESEELTPALRLTRRVVRTKYADVVDALYT